MRAALPQDVGLHRVALEDVFQACGDAEPQLERQQLQHSLQRLWTVSFSRSSALVLAQAEGCSQLCEDERSTASATPGGGDTMLDSCQCGDAIIWLCWLRHAPVGALQPCKGAASQFSFKQFTTCHRKLAHARDISGFYSLTAPRQICKCQTAGPASNRALKPKALSPLCYPSSSPESPPASSEYAMPKAKHIDDL